MMRLSKTRRALPLAATAIGLAALTSAASGCRLHSGSGAATVPDSFVVALETSRGRVDVIARKNWSPLGVGRFYELVSEKHFDGARFFRVVKGFVAQFGLSGDPNVDKAWRTRRIKDDSVKHTNSRGTISFARGDTATRSVQLFINLADNPKLDALNGFGFPPIAEVISGMPAVDSLYSGYGDSAPRSGSQPGREGPSQDSIVASGNAYLERGWPKLDYIKTARVVQQWRTPNAPNP